jgi:hypothetical protein
MAAAGGGVISKACSKIALPPIAVYLIIVNLCFPALWNWSSELTSGLTPRAVKPSNAAFDQLVTVLAKQEDSGRYFTSRRLGLGSHWNMYLPVLYTPIQGGISYGSGSHDSINFYFLDQLRFDSVTTLRKYMELYNIRYLLTTDKHPIDRSTATLIGQQGNFNLYRINGAFGYFSVIAEPRVLEVETPRLSRAIMKKWVAHDYLDGKTFLRLREPLQVAFKMGAGDSPLGVNRSPTFSIQPSRTANANISHGRIISEEAGKWWYECQLTNETDEDWLLLKVTPHPFWRAYIDGQPVEIYYLSPAFMGISLSSGTHQVKFVYEHPRWQLQLLILGGIVIILVIGAELWTRWQARKNGASGFCVG